MCVLTHVCISMMSPAPQSSSLCPQFQPGVHDFKVSSRNLLLTGALQGLGGALPSPHTTLGGARIVEWDCMEEKPLGRGELERSERSWCFFFFYG